MTQSAIPYRWIDGSMASHRRVETCIEGLTDETARQSSLLPGWTVGHLLTHLARNADSHAGMVEAAQRGEIASQYPGGPPQRASDIEAGHRRSASDLVADVRQSNQRLEHAWYSTAAEVWATGLGRRAYGLTSLGDLALLRWREAEIHIIDLALREAGGGDWDALYPSYLDVEWEVMLAGLDKRMPEGLTLLLVPGDRPSRAIGHGDDLVVVRHTPGRILAWLFDRDGDPSWPELRPWAKPS